MGGDPQINVEEKKHYPTPIYNVPGVWSVDHMWCSLSMIIHASIYSTARWSFTYRKRFGIVLRWMRILLVLYMCVCVCRFCWYMWISTVWLLLYGRDADFGALDSHRLCCVERGNHSRSYDRATKIIFGASRELLRRQFFLLYVLFFGSVRFRVLWECQVYRGLILCIKLMEFHFYTLFVFQSWNLFSN